MENVIGRPVAENLLTYATLLTPEEATKVGLIDAVVDSGDLLATAKKYIQEALKLPDFARVFTKQGLRKPLTEGWLSEIAGEGQMGWNLLSSKEMTKQLQAYMTTLAKKSKL